VHGDFAVEVGRILVEGEYSGRESSGEYSYTRAWIKIRGRWDVSQSDHAHRQMKAASLKSSRRSAWVSSSSFFSVVIVILRL
jgi:hypothetical protein